jgi:hypothetical protein
MVPSMTHEEVVRSNLMMLGKAHGIRPTDFLNYVKYAEERIKSNTHFQISVL